MADLFPLGLSITTLILLVFLTGLDLSIENSFTARPAFEIGFLSLLSIFWLAFNVFSTSRWSHVPLNCSSIPSEFPDERTWCTDLQALKSFVWIEWAILVLILGFTVKYVVSQHQKGRTNIWKLALSRYRSEPQFLHPYVDGQFHHVTSHTSSFWEGGTPMSAGSAGATSNNGVQVAFSSGVAF